MWTVQRSGMTGEARALLRTCDPTFRSDDKAALKTAKATLSQAFRAVKRAHTPKNHTDASMTLEAHGTCGRASRPTGHLHLSVLVPLHTVEATESQSSKNNHPHPQQPGVL